MTNRISAFFKTAGWKTPKVRVVGVLGHSLCGSTILNLILDCHPDIFGGGELYYLMEKKEAELPFELVCTNCLSNCRIWTQDFINLSPERNLYSYICNQSGKRVIVDSSKKLDWFREREKDEAGVSFLYVVVVKHPVRHVASYVCRAMEVEGWEAYLKPENTIDLLYEKYNAILDYLEKKRRHFVILQYENLVRNPQEALSRILSRVSLDYIPEMEKYWRKEHHQLAGNMGAVYGATERWSPWNPKTKVHPAKREQYESNAQKGLFVDEKYKNFLTRDQLKQILGNRKVRDFSRRFKIVDEDFEV